MEESYNGRYRGFLDRSYPIIRSNNPAIAGLPDFLSLKRVATIAGFRKRNYFSALLSVAGLPDYKIPLPDCRIAGIERGLSEMPVIE
jgi:hypothetical protein